MGERSCIFIIGEGNIIQKCGGVISRDVPVERVESCIATAILE